MTNPPPSIIRSTTVAIPPREAFDLFTAGMNTWWPREGFSIGTAPLLQAVLEPHVNGRWFERDTDGATHIWGRVLHWQPGRRVVLAWQISADFASDPALNTEVDVRFNETATGATRVDLEHRGLEQYGDRQAEMLAAFSAPAGWQGLLLAYAAATPPVAFDRHTLVMLTLRPDAPQMSPDEAAALQDAHLTYIADRVADGQILAAGPPIDADNERIRGVSVWSVDPETARRLCADDPAVQAGRLAVEVSTWLTPAGQIRFETVRAPRSMAEASGA